MSGMHFEGMAAEYATARPPYPDVVFEALEGEGVIGEGLRVLEIGAGAGLATAALVERGCDVVAIEPGAQLADLLHESVPAAEVLVVRLEDAQLPDESFDSVVAATSLHWVYLDAALPKLHAALRPGGRLAVWRTVFGDDRVRTDFRDLVAAIVSDRGGADEPRREARPSMAELEAGAWFEPVRTDSWDWSIDLTIEQVRRLFATFSNWSPDEVRRAAAAAEEVGGLVTEHYRTLMHLLRRNPRPQLLDGSGP